MILRVFIIIGFILSVIAAAGSFSIYQSYQTEREQRLDAESKAIQLQDAATAAKADLEQQKAHVTELEGQVEALKKAEKDFKSQQSAKDSEIETLKGEISTKSEELRKLQAQIEDLKNNAQALVAPVKQVITEVAAPASVSSITNTFKTPVEPSPVAPATTSAVSSSTPSSNATTMTNTQAMPVSTTSDTSSDKSSVSAEDSRILTVNRKFNFIVINIGLRDGLKMGDKVQVVQGSTQKALAQVEKIYDKFSAATLLSEDKGNPVHEGDSVQKV